MKTKRNPQAHLQALHQKKNLYYLGL